MLSHMFSLPMRGLKPFQVSALSAFTESEVQMPNIWLLNPSLCFEAQQVRIKRVVETSSGTAARGNFRVSYAWREDKKRDCSGTWNRNCHISVGIYLEKGGSNKFTSNLIYTFQVRQHYWRQDDFVIDADLTKTSQKAASKTQFY